jgi:hypothetical protein
MLKIQVTNRTGQSIQLIDRVLKPRESVILEEKTEQIKKLEALMLISIKYLK